MAETKSPGSNRILIADDNVVIRQMISAVVKQEGFSVVTVSDGQEAYNILKDDADFRAAIFDMMMPRLGGIDVIRYMRGDDRLKKIPAMMITAEKDYQLMAQSFNAGATVFLPKPFTPAQLQITFRMLLAGKV
jgi:CheY-like chemotaxis protein